MRRWFARNVRRVAMSLGVRPAWCWWALDFTPGGGFVDVKGGGVRRWWATDEDWYCAVATAYAEACAEIRRRGYRESRLTVVSFEEVGRG
jgi:hypothetical protein